MVISDLKRKMTRAVSSLTLGFFLIFQIGFANPGAGIEIAVSREMPRFFQIDIPTELASLDGIWEARPSPDSRVVLHIQNAHANYGAQKKIKELLEYLNKTYAIRTVFVEGAAEDINPDYLKFFPDKTRNRELADLLARQGELTGSELYLLEADDPSVKGKGVEDPELYRQNYEALKKVFGSEVLVERYLRGYESRLDALSSKIFSNDLRRILADWKKFEKGHREFAPYVQKLAENAKRFLKLDLESLFSQVEWPQITRLLVLQGMEKDLDPAKALDEKDHLVGFLKAKGVSPRIIAEVENFREQRLSVRQGEGVMMQPRDVLEALVREAGPKGFYFRDYPAFSLYAGYLILKNELDAKGLFEEIQVLFGMILDSLAAAPDQRTLLELYRDEDLVRKLLRLELSRRDWQQALARKGQLGMDPLVSRLRDLSKAVTQEMKLEPTSLEVKKLSPKFRQQVLELYDAAFSFYEFARKREAMFYEKINAVMSQDPSKKAVLITGGFHTDGMTDLFREHNISYGVLTPRLMEKSDEKLYRNTMLQNEKRLFSISYLEMILKAQSLKGKFDQGLDIRADLATLLGAFRSVLPKGASTGRAVADAFNASPASHAYGITLEHVKTDADGRDFYRIVGLEKIGFQMTKPEEGIAVAMEGPGAQALRNTLANSGQISDAISALAGPRTIMNPAAENAAAVLARQLDQVAATTAAVREVSAPASAVAAVQQAVTTGAARAEVRVGDFAAAVASARQARPATFEVLGTESQDKVSVPQAIEARAAARSEVRQEGEGTRSGGQGMLRFLSADAHYHALASVTGELLLMNAGVSPRTIEGERLGNIMTPLWAYVTQTVFKGISVGAFDVFGMTAFALYLSYLYLFHFSQLSGALGRLLLKNEQGMPEPGVPTSPEATAQRSEVRGVGRSVSVDDLKPFQIDVDRARRNGWVTATSDKPQALIPNVTDLRINDLILVHRTKYLPGNNRITTLLSAVGEVVSKKLGRLRDTIHTSVNGAVSSHEFGDWKDMPYTILIPAALVSKDQIEKFNPADTYFRGDVFLPTGSFILSKEPRPARAEIGGAQWVVIKDEEDIDRALAKLGFSPQSIDKSFWNGWGNDKANEFAAKEGLDTGGHFGSWSQRFEFDMATELLFAPSHADSIMEVRKEIGDLETANEASLKTAFREGLKKRTELQQQFPFLIDFASLVNGYKGGGVWKAIEETEVPQDLKKEWKEEWGPIQDFLLRDFLDQIKSYGVLYKDLAENSKTEFGVPIRLFVKVGYVQKLGETVVKLFGPLAWPKVYDAVVPPYLKEAIGAPQNALAENIWRNYAAWRWVEKGLAGKNGAQTVVSGPTSGVTEGGARSEARMTAEDHARYSEVAAKEVLARQKEHNDSVALAAVLPEYGVSRVNPLEVFGDPYKGVAPQDISTFTTPSLKVNPMDLKVIEQRSVAVNGHPVGLMREGKKDVFFFLPAVESAIEKAIREAVARAQNVPDEYVYRSVALTSRVFMQRTAILEKIGTEVTVPVGRKLFFDIKESKELLRWYQASRPGSNVPIFAATESSNPSSFIDQDTAAVQIMRGEIYSDGKKFCINPLSKPRSEAREEGPAVSEPAEKILAYWRSQGWLPIGIDRQVMYEAGIRAGLVNGDLIIDETGKNFRFNNNKRWQMLPDHWYQGTERTPNAAEKLLLGAKRGSLIAGNLTRDRSYAESYQGPEKLVLDFDFSANRFLALQYLWHPFDPSVSISKPIPLSLLSETSKRDLLLRVPNWSPERIRIAAESLGMTPDQVNGILGTKPAVSESGKGARSEARGTETPERMRDFSNAVAAQLTPRVLQWLKAEHVKISADSLEALLGGIILPAEALKLGAEQVAKILSAYAAARAKGQFSLEVFLKAVQDVVAQNPAFGISNLPARTVKVSDRLPESAELAALAVQLAMNTGQEFPYVFSDQVKNQSGWQSFQESVKKIQAMKDASGTPLGGRLSFKTVKPSQLAAGAERTGMIGVGRGNAKILRRNVIILWGMDTMPDFEGVCTVVRLEKEGNQGLAASQNLAGMKGAQTGLALGALPAELVKELPEVFKVHGKDRYFTMENDALRAVAKILSQMLAQAAVSVAA